MLYFYKTLSVFLQVHNLTLFWCFLFYPVFGVFLIMVHVMHLIRRQVNHIYENTLNLAGIENTS